MKRTIKLRDITKEQWDNFLHKCHMNCNRCPFNQARCIKSENKNSWFNNKDIYSDKFLDQEVEIATPDILNEVEKKYLRNIIKPFRNRVISISKYFYVLDNAYSIEIYMKSIQGIFSTEYLRLPFFKNEMYKGMERNKSYTLEELDL